MCSHIATVLVRGLRDYGIDPVIWDGEAGCEHEWGNEIIGSDNLRHRPGHNSQVGNSLNPEIHKGKENAGGQFCRKCNAWLGSYGLEPTMELYLQHTVQIFREVRRVLRKDGTLWLNLGDSYAADRGGSYMPSETLAGGISGQGEEKTKRGRGDNGFARRDCKKYGLKHKDLCMLPARVAIALQADGWWIRSQIIWAKGVSFCKTYSGSVMPESCRDRPTKAYELVYLMTKSAHYFYDADAVREENLPQSIKRNEYGYKQETGLPRCWRPENNGIPISGGKKVNMNLNPAGRNLRDVWIINPHAFKEAHFATFPPALVAPMIKAGTSEYGVCKECGAPWERVVEKGNLIGKDRGGNYKGREIDKKVRINPGTPGFSYETQTTGWRPTCSCNAETTHAVVLDPFMGSGTTALVAKQLNRDFIGIELNPEYIKIAERRLKAVHPELELI